MIVTNEDREEEEEEGLSSRVNQSQLKIRSALTTTSTITSTNKSRHGKLQCPTLVLSPSAHSDAKSQAHFERSLPTIASASANIRVCILLLLRGDSGLARGAGEEKKGCATGSGSRRIHLASGVSSPRRRLRLRVCCWRCRTPIF